ncbi:MAG: transposase family protein [Bacillota bacterium]
MGRPEILDLNCVGIEGTGGLLEYLTQMTDPRKRRGIRHTQISILAVAVCAVLSGARNFAAIGEWAGDLSQSLLKRLGCRLSERSGKYTRPASLLCAEPCSP